MPEIEIKEVTDIKKLEGWTIKLAYPVPNTTRVHLVLSHPAAEHDIIFQLFAEATVGLNGNLINVNPLLGMKTFDVEEQND